MRLAVYADGFNLYNAINDLAKENEHLNALKWLDLWALSEDLKECGETVSLVKYFSAYVTWNEPKLRRHQRYVNALEGRGVKFIEGHFKDRSIRCKKCDQSFKKREEKETDVNIGCHLMADALTDQFDRAIVISADTDLNGAIELCRSVSGKKVLLAAPPELFRSNSLASFEISQARIERCLLPISLAFDGRIVTRPLEYDPPDDALKVD